MGEWSQLPGELQQIILRKVVQNGFIDLIQIGAVCTSWRCQLWQKEVEMKEMKEQFNELVGLLRQSEARRKEIEKQQKLREQAIAIALATSASVVQLHRSEVY